MKWITLQIPDEKDKFLRLTKIYPFVSFNVQAFVEYIILTHDVN